MSLRKFTPDIAAYPITSTRTGRPYIHQQNKILLDQG